MNSLNTIIIRHRKENLKKCSLRGLESRSDISFYTYPLTTFPDFSSHILLTLDAPILSSEDTSPLLIIDGTWKYAQKMIDNLPLHLLIKRSLPTEIKTAYPRRQADCPEPERGLASVEALFAAYFVSGKNTQGLLDHYYWKSHFLEKNEFFFNSYRENN